MHGWLSILTVLCSLISLGLFFFIFRFAMKTEMVITTSIFTLFVTVGLFSWAMHISLPEESANRLWADAAFLSGLLMFPLLIYLFVQRTGSTSFIVSSTFGHMVRFSPVAAQVLTHYLLPDEFARFLDFIFFSFWLAITFYVWKLLYARKEESSSEIRRNQIEFMLSSFFVVMLYNLMFIFYLFFPQSALDFSVIYCVAIVVALLMTAHGLVRYQLVIGTELLMRNSMILLLTSIICVSLFITVQLFLLSIFGQLVPNFEVAVSAIVVVVIVLFINPINNLATIIVERVSPQLKWQESNVKELFVLHSNGLVIAHAGQERNGGEIDRDMVGGMIAAIQNFVQEAFLDSEMETLKALSMGKLRMLIEARGFLVVAVLFTGHEARELRRDVDRLVRELEERFGNMLVAWKGNRSGVREVQLWAEDVLRRMRKEPA